MEEETIGEYEEEHDLDDLAYGSYALYSPKKLLAKIY